MNFQVKGFNGALVAEALGVDLQRSAAEIPGAFRLDGGQVVKLLAHHRRHQLDAGQLFHRVFAHQGAVAEHGDAIAHRIDLLQEVGDKDNPHALIPQAAHQDEELLHFVVVQR